MTKTTVFYDCFVDGFELVYKGMEKSFQEGDKTGQLVGVQSLRVLFSALSLDMEEVDGKAVRNLLKSKAPLLWKNLDGLVNEKRYGTVLALDTAFEKLAGELGA